MAVATVALLETLPPPNANDSLAVAPLALPARGVFVLAMAIEQPLMVSKLLSAVPYAIPVAPPLFAIAILAGVDGIPLGAVLMVADGPD